MSEWRSMPTSGEFLAARICAILALLVVAGFSSYWVYTSSQLSIGCKLAIGGVAGAIIFALGLGSQLWVDTRQYPRLQIAPAIMSAQYGEFRLQGRVSHCVKLTKPYQIQEFKCR